MVSTAPRHAVLIPVESIPEVLHPKVFTLRPLRLSLSTFRLFN